MAYEQYNSQYSIHIVPHSIVRLAHKHSLHKAKCLPPSLYEANVGSSNVLFEITGTSQGLMAWVPSMKLMGRPNQYNKLPKYAQIN